MHKLPIINKLMIMFVMPFIIMFIITCRENDLQNSVTRIDIANNTNNFRSFRISDLNCELEYIVLATKNAPILSSINSVDISSDHIIIADRDKCVLFDRSGRFISKIGSKGRGPGEYHGLGQVRLLDDRIFLPDYGKQEFIIYNPKGELMKTVKTPGNFSPTSPNWIPLTDTTYLVRIANYTGDKQNRIALIDNKGEILKNYQNTAVFFREKPIYGTFDHYAHFYKNNEEIIYKESLSDTIYRVGNKKLFPLYIIDRGEYGFPIEYWGFSDRLSLEKYSNQINLSNVLESLNYVYFTLIFGKHYPFTFYKDSPHSPSGVSHYPIIGLYNKADDDFFLVTPSNVDHQIEPTGIKNDIDGGINFMPRYAVNDTLLVSWFEAYELKLYVATETFQNSSPKYPEKKKELEELAASLDENDNPVLMLVKLKK